jgi:hypothetical protein
LDQDKKEISVDDLVEKYYPNSEDYFEQSWKDVDSRHQEGIDDGHAENFVTKKGIQIEYPQNQKIDNKSDENAADNINNTPDNQESAEKLFDGGKSNNFISYCEECTANRNTSQFLNCPQCSFENIYPEVIAHHIRYTHPDKK